MASSKQKLNCPIVEIEVRPHENLRTTIGRFTSTDVIKGFSVELSPEKISKDLIKTKIIYGEKIGDLQEYVLKVVNGSSEPVCAEVWPL